MAPKVKTIKTQYLIKIDGTFLDVKDSLKEARKLIKLLVFLNEEFSDVSIIKQTTNESIVDTYHVETTKVLVSSQLDEGME